MIAHLTGALARAILVVLLIATPSLLLPSVSADAAQFVALAAILAAALTLFEYSSTYPGLIEFRDAPPFNRIRFSAMFVAVFLMSIMYQSELSNNAIVHFVRAVGDLLGMVMDFPYSPVRLFVLMLPPDTAIDKVLLMRTMAGTAYFISIMSLAAFSVLLRVNRWPVRNGSFNVWINLPTFDPTAGGDVVDRLARSSRLNMVIGFLLPFVIPALVTASSTFYDPLTLNNPQTLIWTVSAWALLPAGLMMRGIALRRIANLIQEQRRRAVPQEDGEFQLA